MLLPLDMWALGPAALVLLLLLFAAAFVQWVTELATRPAAMKLARPRLWPKWTLPLVRNTFQTAMHAHHIYDWLVAQSEHFGGQPFWLGLPGGAKVVVLSAPEQFEDVLKTHFETFDKGPVMTENLRDLLGDGIFAVDDAKWAHQRKTASNLFTLRSLRESMIESIHKHARVLTAILARKASQNEEVDLFNLLNRFTIETFSEIGFGVQLGCLDSETDHPFQAAFDSAQRVLVHRFMRPQWFWKLQRFLGVSMEGGLKRSVRVIDDMVLGIIGQSLENRKAPRRSEWTAAAAGGGGGGDDGDTTGRKKDLVSLFLDSVSGDAGGSSGASSVDTTFDPAFLRDIVVSFLIAGRDTTAQALSWFFYSLSQHPAVTRKVRDELAATLPELLASKLSSPSMEQVQQLVYLEAVLRETLRLYPSVPANIKQANKDVLLSDGTFVRQNEGVLISSYVLGRMAHVWGPDAKAFRPERWLDARTNKLVSVSAFQFNAFHAGPRMCLGMNLAMMEMKIVAATVLAKFRLELAPGQRVTYDFSLTHPIKGQLRMNVVPAV